MSSNSVEFIFLKRSIEVFNQDLEKLIKLLKDFDSEEQNLLLDLLEGVKENIQYIEKLPR